MGETEPFTIEQMCKCMSRGKLMGGKCRKCGKIHFPPRPLCDSCFSKDFEWVEMPTEGKLLTYTIIHVAPAQFQSMAPYAMGIVQLENGPKVPGMIKEVPLDQMRIGMHLKVTFEACVPSQTWPQWPRYHFKPV
jgi:hypothetical protein